MYAVYLLLTDGNLQIILKIMVLISWDQGCVSISYIVWLVQLGKQLAVNVLETGGN